MSTLFSYLYLLDLRRWPPAALLCYRVLALCLYLQNEGVDCKVTKFLRKRKTAHRWSTAYHIVNGDIQMRALRELENGRDLDGNLWYCREWDTGNENESTNAPEAIKANAIHLGPPHTVYSEEGYEANDPRRLPNRKDVPISKHVYGLAIDVLVEWDQLGGPWSDRAQALCAELGLLRPIVTEAWHLELDVSRRFVVPPHRLMIWAIQHQRTRVKRAQVSR